MDSQKKNGADFIKVYSGLNREALTHAILDESRRQGIPVQGHVPDVVTGAEASREGQKSSPAPASSPPRHVHHARPNEGLPQPSRPRTISKPIRCFWRCCAPAATNNVESVCPAEEKWQLADAYSHRAPLIRMACRSSSHAATPARNTSVAEQETGSVSSEGDPRLRGWTVREYGVALGSPQLWKALSALCSQNGVPSLAGRDPMESVCISLGIPAFYDELAYFVESGVTPLGALQAATRRVPGTFMKCK